LITGPTRAPTPVVTTSPSNLDDLFVQLIGTTIRDDIGLPFQGADNELAITGLVSFRWEIRTTVRGMSAGRDRPQHARNDFHASRLLYDSPRSRSECLGRLSRDCHTPEAMGACRQMRTQVAVCCPSTIRRIFEISSSRDPLHLGWSGSECGDPWTALNLSEWGAAKPRLSEFVKAANSSYALRLAGHKPLSTPCVLKDEPPLSAKVKLGRMLMMLTASSKDGRSRQSV
jgi:hypothetical protein